MSKKFFPAGQVVPAFMPVDLSTADNEGDWVKFGPQGRCLIIFASSVGTAGDDPQVELEQASSATGTGAKALNFTELRTKRGATAINAVGQFTKVTQAASSTYTDDASAENEFLAVLEIDAEDLDRNNGFNWFRLKVDDVGTNAQLGCGLYVFLDPRRAEPDASEAETVIA